jgi:hypothetical protein
MAKGNRSLAAKAMKHSQDRRYGGAPRKTWALDTTAGNFAPRGFTTPSDKADARETLARIALFAEHF